MPGVPPNVRDYMEQAADAKPAAMPFVSDVMDEDEYNDTWVKSLPRNGRSDDEMRALMPDHDAYNLMKGSDLVSYHKKAKKDLTS